MENASKLIKLIAIDIDGTLLNPQGQITSRTRAAIRAAQHAGVIVTLATARRYGGAQAVAEALGLELPLIVYDGTLIVSHPSRAILASQTLEPEIARQACEIFQQYAIQPVTHPCESELCIAEEVWTGPAEFDNPGLQLYLTAAGERVKRMPYTAIHARTTRVLRVVAFAEREMLERALPEIANLGCSWNFAPRGSYGSAELAVLPAGCSKASGVATLAARYEIALAEVMALGDNYNDLEMLRIVGLGVAMGQAPEQVKAVAQAVTATNKADGVALAIERYVLATQPQEALIPSGEPLAEAALLRSFNILP
ncbi:MAG TPA: Cof-type HAD-IIB family hydrolase [Ktedonobacteraceae bacterium]